MQQRIFLSHDTSDDQIQKEFITNCQKKLENAQADLQQILNKIQQETKEIKTLQVEFKNLAITIQEKEINKTNSKKLVDYKVDELN